MHMRDIHKPVKVHRLLLLLNSGYYTILLDEMPSGKLLFFHSPANGCH
jgi:hypothetical protein